MSNSRSSNVIEAVVCPTLEVFVTVEPVPLEKKRDPESGLALIDARSKWRFRFPAHRPCWLWASSVQLRHRH
jgi:hypothetical protein